MNKRKRLWYNNGEQQKYFYDGDETPDGWSRGVLPLTDEKKKLKTERTVATNLKKYGVTNTFNTPEVMAKSHSADVVQLQKERREQTKQQKYGDKNWSNSVKAQQTMQDLYGGALHGSQVTSAKIHQTIRDKYGYDKTHFNALYKYDDIEFDSSWELYYYLYCQFLDIPIQRCTEVFEYEVGGKLHHYEPDFKVGDKYIEIKGDQFLDDEGNLHNKFTDDDEIMPAKGKCMKEHQVEILSWTELKPIIKYIKNQLGSHYIDQFKIKSF